jgi:hypothetical protein
LNGEDYDAIWASLEELKCGIENQDAGLLIDLIRLDTDPGLVQLIVDNLELLDRPTVNQSLCRKLSENNRAGATGVLTLAPFFPSTELTSALLHYVRTRNPDPAQRRCVADYLVEVQQSEKSAVLASLCDELRAEIDGILAREDAIGRFFDEYSRNQQIMLAREEFKQKNYRAVVELLKPLVTHLRGSDYKRLVYSEKQVRTPR